MAKKKYYVVWIGVQPGIYESWDACKQQISGYPNARYKSYTSKQEAEEAFGMGPDYSDHKKKAKRSVNSKDPKIIQSSWSVDAACSGNPGNMEYQGVHTSDKSQIFHAGPYKYGTNNVGEFLAIVHALSLMKKISDNTTPIYSDSKTAMAWVNNKYAKTNLKENKANPELLKIVIRAENWLKSNTFKNPILKWDTKSWGEIPADFGRK